MEDRRGRDGRVGLEVRHSVAGLVDDATVAAHTEPAAGPVVVELTEYAIDGAGRGVGGGVCLRARADRNGDDAKNQEGSHAFDMPPA